MNWQMNVDRAYKAPKIRAFFEMVMKHRCCVLDAPTYKHKSVQNFYNFIQGDLTMRMCLTNLIDEASHITDPYVNVDNLDDFFMHIDVILETTPSFDPDWLRSVPFLSFVNNFLPLKSSLEFFRNEQVNKHLSFVLKEWCEYLLSEKSTDTLNKSTTGWLCSQADSTIHFKDYVMDLNQPHGGFKSFNAFFSRDLKPGARPIDSPDDNTIVTSVCDSKPYAVVISVTKKTEFWIKDSLYSLDDVLGKSPFANDFIDGTAFQSFLNPWNYHGWHAPVSGKILEVKLLPGFYYSTPSQNVGYIDCLSYLTHVSARAVVIIQADNVKYGKVAVINVGMAEVSSCLLLPTIVAGYHIKKGEKIGTFQFGGSTYCMMFQQYALEEVYLKPREDRTYDDVKVGQRLAKLIR